MDSLIYFKLETHLVHSPTKQTFRKIMKLMEKLKQNRKK